MTPTQPTKVKYLTNKDLLAEIHKSKISYCSYLENEHAYYDFIVPNIKKITKKKINEARKKKLNERLAQYKKLPASEKPKKAPVLSDISPESIIIRVMTFDHIPMNPEKEFTGKTENERHIRVNFPPFQHYIIKNDEPTCVLKSHWKNGLENGEFCKDHGKMTHHLASMFIKLVDRYGHRGNWRGYTYLDEMKSQALLQLSQVGLQFDESRSETPNPFAYLTQVITNSFMRILNLEKKNQNIRDDMLIMHGAAPSHTRQTEDYLKQHESSLGGAADPKTAIPVKRSPWGRKPKAATSINVSKTPVVKKTKAKPKTVAKRKYSKKK